MMSGCRQVNLTTTRSRLNFAVLSAAVGLGFKVLVAKHLRPLRAVRRQPPDLGFRVWNRSIIQSKELRGKNHALSR